MIAGSLLGLRSRWRTPHELRGRCQSTPPGTRASDAIWLPTGRVNGLVMATA